MDDIILGTHDDAGNKQKTDTMQRQPKKNMYVSVYQKNRKPVTSVSTTGVTTVPWWVPIYSFEKKSDRKELTKS